MAGRPTRVRYRILAWLTLAAALSYLCRNAVGVAESSIRADLGLTLTESGWFLGAFFWSYAILQIPSGWFSQKYGTRFSLTLFATAWSLAMLMMGFSPPFFRELIAGLQEGFVETLSGLAKGGIFPATCESFATLIAKLSPAFIILLLAQILMGVAQAGIFPASCNSIGVWMPVSERSFACGMLSAGMQLGAVATGALTGVLLAPLGWRWVFALFSVPGILWAIAFYIRFRNHPEEVSWLNQGELKVIRNESPETAPTEDAKPAAPPAKWNWVHAIDLWLLCGQQICRSGGYMFFASWFPTFLQSTRGISVEASGYLQGFVLTGYLLGSIIGGGLMDWIWRRTGNLWLSRCGVGAASLGSCGLLVLGAWFVENITVAVGLLTLCSFCAAFAGPSMFATTIDIGGDRVPEVFGLVNMMGNLATAICPVVIGWLFEKLPNWNLILVLFSVLYLLGAVMFLLINPRRGAKQPIVKNALAAS